MNIPVFEIGARDVLLDGHQQQDANDDMFITTGRGTEKAIAFLNQIFRKAVQKNIADVHFKMTDQLCRIRYRMPGGDLTHIDNVDREWMKIIDDKIRARARIPSTDRRTPQDGRLSLTIAGQNIDVRVSITPAVSDGQLIVCRILNQEKSKMNLADIRMPMAAREAFRQVIHEPNGLFMITGPTGSGKTTTLYAMLNELNNGTRNIITIENPVEYRIDDFHQIGVDHDYVSFAGALRAVLRQDPDVIMVGEIRDKETASMAVQAALTGHLVLSTLHANNAAVGIRRLIDLGVDPMNLSAALRCITAQRLVRTINPEANLTTENATDAERAWLRAHNISRKEYLYPRIKNHLTDYMGYAPVMEIIMADNKVKKVLDQGETSIYAAASSQPQFETLAHAAEHLANEGITSLCEARRVASAQDAPEITNKRLGKLLLERDLISSETLDKLLHRQAKQKSNDINTMLGKMIVELGLVEKAEIMDLIGFTANAHGILKQLCQTESTISKLEALLPKWKPGTTSLFDMAIEAGIITKNDLNAVQDY